MKPGVTLCGLDRAAARVSLGPAAGYLFAGESLDILCFVPEACVSFDAAGRASVDPVRYVTSGWSRHNVRGSDSATSASHVLPDPRQLVLAASVPDLPVRLARWRALAGPAA